MTTFNQREQAFERKFVLDEEAKFKSEMLCMSELGKWAAAKLGLSGSSYDAYIAGLRKEDIIGNEAAVIEKIKGDFLAQHIGCAEAEIREFIAAERMKVEDRLSKQP